MNNKGKIKLLETNTGICIHCGKFSTDLNDLGMCIDCEEKQIEIQIIFSMKKETPLYY